MNSTKNKSSAELFKKSQAGRLWSGDSRRLARQEVRRGPQEFLAAGQILKVIRGLVITNFIVITGASKGIGRAAADALVEQGWSVIGIARSSPRSFPGVFIETDLGDPDQTRALADDLAARGDVFGIVNSGGRISFELRRGRMVARASGVSSVN